MPAKVLQAYSPYRPVPRRGTASIKRSPFVSEDALGMLSELLLHDRLARHGSVGNGWRGVTKMLQRAGIPTIPDHCAVAVFVGTEFDSVTGRGGDDGAPKRRTPWGELAWQLGGAESFA